MVVLEGEAVTGFPVVLLKPEPGAQDKLYGPVPPLGVAVRIVDPPAQKLLTAALTVTVSGFVTVTMLHSGEFAAFQLSPARGFCVGCCAL